jgi:predicted glycosyltransferase
VKDMKTIFLYVHDEKGYGHLSRMTKIYDLLEKDFSPVFLIWGTLNPPKNREYFKLPYATEFEDYSDGWEQDKKNLLVRKAFLKDLIDWYDNFDILIDYFPFGRIIFSDEIDMLIEETHKKKWKIHSVMRDIFTWTRKRDEGYYKQAHNILEENNISVKQWDCLSADLQRKIYSVLKNHDMAHGAINLSLDYYLGLGWIDSVLVFWDSEVYDLRDEFKLTDDQKSKFSFLWYLTWMSKVTVEKKQNEPPYVLVSFWWNIFDKKKFIQLLHLCCGLESINFKIVFGSMMSSQEILSIREKYQKHFHMEFIDFTDKFHDLFVSAKVFIWAWWYGTLMDVVHFKIPSYLFVNQNNVVKVNETEQMKRIQVFQEYAPIESIEDITPVFIKHLMGTYFRNETDVSQYENIGLIDTLLLNEIISWDNPA